MDFIVLKELVKFVTLNKVKEIDIFEGKKHGESRLTQLYDGIAQNRFSTEDEAAQFFFGATSDSHNPNYRKLHQRLVRQLINTVFFVDVNQPVFSDMAKAFHQCQAEFAAANILYIRNMSFVAIFILERILEPIQRYEFVELGADVARMLRREYSRTHSNLSKHTYYDKLYRTYEEKRRLEHLAGDYHEALISYYIEHRVPDKEIHDKALLFYEELLPYENIVCTSKFYSYLYHINIIRFFSINDCENALLVCEQCLLKLKQQKYINKVLVLGTLLQKMLCVTHLRLFEDNIGDRTATEFFSLTDEGNFNWFRGMELYLHYNLHIGRYQEALKNYQNARQHARFEVVMHGSTRDTWELYGGYLHLLAALGQLDAEAVNAVAGRFKYSKFMNNITVLGKEKMGMNIPLVLLPVLYGLATSSLDATEFSADAFIKYRKRYLDNTLNIRSSAFANLLLALSNQAYEAGKSAKIIKRELATLKQEKPLISRQTVAVEIIPYEVLWELLTAL